MPDLVRTVGRYGIVRELGRGGMGVVYLAWQGDLERLVALKELGAFHAADPALARRFVRESRMAGSFTHANVVTVYDYFEHEGAPYIAMEYLERGSLRPYVGGLELAQIGGVLDGLLAGLEAAAQHGIVHRDLKPENVLVSSEGGVKIADFGIAKATQGAQTTALLTETGAALGTPMYMAPEQAMGQEIGPWTDLYSVGCIAYELVTGKPPFHDATTPMAILVRHVTDHVPPAAEVADVDADISAWIERLTAKAPELRPPSASAAGEALEDLLVGKLGPVWRRAAPLPTTPPRLAAASSPGSDYVSFVSPQAAAATPRPLEGIDLEGTGPDTPPPARPLEGVDLERSGPDTPPSAAAASDDSTPGVVGGERGSETVFPPIMPTDPRPPQPVQLPPDVAPRQGEVQASASGAPSVRADAATAREESPLATVRAGSPPRARALARGGALALLFAIVLPLIATEPDGWNLFAVLSPFEAIGAALGSWLAARALQRGNVAVAAGALVGFGALTTIAALGLIKFTLERLSAPATIITLIVLGGALAILLAGIAAARAAAAPPTVTPIDPGTLVLGLVGVALACAALLVHYDGFSSLWSEVGERDSAEFFFEPMVAAAGALAGVIMLGTRPRFASGLLIAVGTALTLHYLGLTIAAWRAIGEVGEVRAAGPLGFIGGLLIASAGANGRH